MEEILKGQVIIRSRAFATFSATEFSRAGRKDLAGHMRPAGRMLCRPALRFTRGLVSDDHVTSTGRNGQWKSREKNFAITQDSVSAAV